MATAWSETLIIVIKPAALTEANQLLAVADPASVGDALTVPLRTKGDLTNTVWGYWCRWQMKPEQRALVVSEFGNRYGNPTIYNGNQNIPKNRQYWLLNAAEGEWTAAEVLAEFNVEPISLRPQ